MQVAKVSNQWHQKDRALQVVYYSDNTH